MNEPTPPVNFDLHRQLVAFARKCLVSGACVAAAIGVMLPLSAQGAGTPVFSEADVPAPRLAAPAGPGFAPQHFNDSVAAMVEFQDPPAAVVYAESIKASLARAGNVSFDSLDPTARATVTQTASGLGKAQAARIEAAQLAVLPTLEATGKVVFRVKSAYNGVSMYVSRGRLAELRVLPGVKDVHVQIPKFQTAAQDIDFLGARSSWVKTNATNPYGMHGENVKIAIIDSGLDYIHTNFGGPGTPAAYSSVTDTGPVPNPYFPTLKVPGGYDFAGDAYTGANVPVPDPNPLDSTNGHGTACASLIGGLGVAVSGATFVGVYDNATDIASMRISPGFAPKSELYPLRVFGVTGSTNLVVQAIDWAIDPNGDGTLTDHMHVISMSLGANTGDPSDPDGIAATAAAAAGVIVVSAAGNAGDSYFIVSSPSVANNTLSVAASFNDNGGFFYDSNLTANSPPAIAGSKYYSVYGQGSPAVAPAGLTADVAYANLPLACSALTGGSMTGKMCLVDRGTCTFAVKIANCEAAGAIATIVANNAGNPGLMGSAGGTKPSVMISQADGALIKAQLALPAVVNVTLNNDPNGYLALPGTAGDTMASYSARGPRAPDAMLKPDITAPAEVVGVAVSMTGSNVGSFNGTSSATPHVSGIMALLRQLHPGWTVEELMALAMNTATHDVFTGPAGTGNEYGAGRAGAGRIDVANAMKANVVAYNETDRGLVSVSFGIVEVPVAGTNVLSKNITVVNKGAVDVTYNLSYADATPVAGAAFTVGSGPSILVPAGGSVTVPVTFTGTGNLLKHVREASVPQQLPAGTSRQWLTEKTGYAVLTPTGGTEPVLRVALYASPKPVSTMHATPTSVSVSGVTGTTNIGLTGTPVNTGASTPIDIVSLAKPFELQYESAAASSSINVLKRVGVTSDYLLRATKADAVLTFALEGFGPAAAPDWQMSDKEIYIDVDNDGNFDYFVYLGSAANGSATSNAYYPVVIDLVGGGGFLRFRTNGIDPGSLDTNAYSNNVVTFPIRAGDIGLGAGTFSYEVVTFDRNNTLIDDTGLLTYDLAAPGLDGQGGNLDPFFYPDLATTVVPVAYNFTNIAANGSLGLMMVHMHNGAGAHADTVPFAQTFTLTVTKAGAGTGTVTSSPAGITCGATCAAEFDSGEVVTLTAAATGSSAFTGWSVDAPIACGTNLTCDVTMSAAKNVTATFLPTFLLTVSKAGNGSGTVSSLAPNLGTISCGATCSATFVSGTVVTLHAVADAGKNFTAWSAAACPTTADCVLTITAATGVTATFTDTAAPETSITGSPPNPSSEAVVMFTFTSTEPGSTFLCSLDGAPFTACASPLTITVGDGVHTFRVAGVDPAGNVDPSPASYTWTTTLVVAHTPIPTLSDWTLAMLALTLGALGFAAARRRR